jgi:hypothetical protein
MIGEEGGGRGAEGRAGQGEASECLVNGDGRKAGGEVGRVFLGLSVALWVGVRTDLSSGESNTTQVLSLRMLPTWNVATTWHSKDECRVRPGTVCIAYWAHGLLSIVVEVYGSGLH